MTKIVCTEGTPALTLAPNSKNSRLTNDSRMPAQEHGPGQLEPLRTLAGAAFPESHREFIRKGIAGKYKPASGLCQSRNEPPPGLGKRAFLADTTTRGALT